MPIQLNHVDQLSAPQIRTLLEQLTSPHIQVETFYRVYTNQILQAPEGYLHNPQHRNRCLHIIRRYAHELRSPELGPDGNIVSDFEWPTSEQMQRVSEAMAQIARRIQDGLESAFYFGGPVRANRMQVTRLPDSSSMAWESEFLKEFPASNDWSLIQKPLLFQEKRPYPPLEEEKELMTKKDIPLGKLADMLPSGLVGMHFVGEKPYNLLFKPEKPDDPSLEEIERRGWFRVTKHEDVLYAPAVLEPYFTLIDSGIPHNVSVNVDNWVKARKYSPDLPFTEECPLFDYQREAVEFLSWRDRAMLSLSPGLGKTLTSAYAAAAQEGVKYVLLVCPASLLYFWRAELEKWSEHLARKPIPVVWHKETIAVEIEPKENEQLWIITNPETLVKHLDTFRLTKNLGFKFDLMIGDESIMFKHRYSQRAEAVKKMAKIIPRVWLLTGAPATRYLDDMWHQLHILDERGWSSYWRWAKEYTVVEETQWGTNVVANKRDGPERVKENIQDVYFARSQEQVANIPQWLFDDLDLPMTKQQQDVYEKLRKELIIELKDIPDSEPLKIRSHIDLMLKSLQVLSNPLLVGSVNSSGKWGALDELLYLYPGPYIVWINFIRTGEIMLDTLKKRFGENKVALMNGKTAVEDRNTAVERVQAGEIQAIIMNGQVGKFGFNLTNARTAFFLERMYDDSYWQCIHRNRRIGTTVSPNIVHMRSCTMTGGRTLDHTVHDTQDYRTGMIKTLTVGDIKRGLGMYD